MIDTDALARQLQIAIPSLSAVYLFGSQARGTAGPESDVDLAILADEPMHPPVLGIDHYQAPRHGRTDG